MKTVGVLAIQGDVAEHERALGMAGSRTRLVRRAVDLDGLDGLVLPGGESTTIGMLAAETGLLTRVRSFLADGGPVWGTCAGVILLADRILDAEPVLGGLDVTVERNAFGRQVHSFEADLSIPAIGPPAFRAVFIRAPIIRRAGPGVEVLARLGPEEIVAARSGRCLGTVFHPELTNDLRLAQLFISAL